MHNTSETNKVTATRFIEAFNTDDWDIVREVVDPGFVLTHPAAGTVHLGPEGMIAVWSHFKAALPDSWHPIPVTITEGDYLANLLPTYGHFDGEPHQGIPPTGKWLEYGMVNEVLPKDELIDRAYQIADHIMTQPRTTRRLTTQIIRRPWRQRISNDLDGGFGIQMFGHLAKQKAMHTQNHVATQGAYVKQGKRNNFD